jgi:hypothetical protein
MRRRLPSPALVVASVALFVALGGAAGFAASLALVKSPQPVTLISGSVSADGKVAGARLTGHRASAGVYTLTVSANAFHLTDRTAAGHAWNNSKPVKSSTGTMIPSTCDTAGEVIKPNGSATVEVDCFTYDGATGWVPTDAAFDFLMLGPSR